VPEKRAEGSVEWSDSAWSNLVNDYRIVFDQGWLTSVLLLKGLPKLFFKALQVATHPPFLPRRSPEESAHDQHGHQQRAEGELGTGHGLTPVLRKKPCEGNANKTAGGAGYPKERDAKPVVVDIWFIKVCVGQSSQGPLGQKAGRNVKEGPDGKYRADSQREKRRSSEGAGITIAGHYHSSSRAAAKERREPHREMVLSQESDGDRANDGRNRQHRPQAELKPSAHGENGTNLRNMAPAPVPEKCRLTRLLFIRGWPCLLVDLHAVGGSGVNYDTITGLNGPVITAIHDQAKVVNFHLNFASPPINDVTRNLIRWILVATTTAARMGMDNIDEDVRGEK
jgi:hypothetical protein